MRTFHTGVVRKRILPVVIHRPDEVYAPTCHSAAFLLTASPPRPSETVAPSLERPSFLPGLDIRASALQPPDSSRPTARPRGTGKLLSSVQGVALALLRLEHVEGAQRGNLKLEFEAGAGDGQTTKWGVSHWWPHWWPHEPPKQDGT